MEKKGGDNIVYGAHHTFRFSFLLRYVRARKTHFNAIYVIMILEILIIVFIYVFRLKLFDIGIRLIFNESTKMKKFGIKTLDFARNG